MANPKMVLSIAIGKKESKEDELESKMCELVEKAFTTRNLLHFAHLSTKSYASHVALGDMYDSIIDKIDDIAEVYQGKFGLLSNLEQCEAKIPSDITKYVKDEADWIDDNRMFISKGYKPVDNMLDDLLALYNKTIYKLENLH
jgi:phage-related minor tail protein